MGNRTSAGASGAAEVRVVRESDGDTRVFSYEPEEGTVGALRAAISGQRWLREAWNTSDIELSVDGSRLVTTARIREVLGHARDMRIHARCVSTAVLPSVDVADHAAVTRALERLHCHLSAGSPPFRLTFPDLTLPYGSGSRRVPLTLHVSATERLPPDPPDADASKRLLVHVLTRVLDAIDAPARRDTEGARRSPADDSNEWAPAAPPLGLPRVLSAAEVDAAAVFFS
jgi:hypothetical protein